MIVKGVYGSETLKPKEVLHNPTSKEVEVKKSNSVSVGSPLNINEASLLTYDDGSKKKVETETNQVEPPKEEKWDDTKDRISSDDCNELSKEDTDIMALEADELEMALTRIKEQRGLQEESIEEQKVKLELKEESVKSLGKYSKVSKKIYDQLEKYNLPLTEENVLRMASVLEISSVIPNIENGSIQYLIKNNLEPTAKNIYKAIYSGNSKGKDIISEATYKSLENSANQVIDNSLLEDKDEAKEIAKWLLGNQLPLTEESLWAYKDMASLKENYHEDAILDRIVKGFREGQSPEDVYLGSAYEERVNNVRDSILHIDEQRVKHTLINNQSNKIINCCNLIQGQNESSKVDMNNALLGSKVDNGLNSVDNNSSNMQSIDIKSITILRQLEEIRLKMTVEAGSKLIKQGINIETADLSKLVDGLREIENNYYKNLLSERKVDISEANVELLKNNLEKIEDLKGMPNFILGSTYKQHGTQTIDTLYNEGNTLKAELVKANEAYETLMTTPRKDLGDSIQKAFRNVDEILKDMNLETTKDNQRAVRILGYNSMEITHDNINNMKAYDSDVNYMMKNLHPSVTVELIKRGINPSDMPINELNHQIDEIKEEIGVSKEEKYSKYLWKLEKEQGITKEEKESYIGIYRLLNNVEKTNGAAIGAVVKADQDVTLNNLLTAVRTMKSSGVEANIDDNFGLLNNVSYKNDKITDQIKAGFIENGNEDKVQSYIGNLIKEIKSEISPNQLESLGNMDKILNTPLDVLYDELLEVAPDDINDTKYYEERKLEYENILKDSKEAMGLLKDSNLPSNLYNVQGAKEYLSLDNTFFHQYKKHIGEGKPEGKNSTTMDNEYSVSSISDDIIDSFTDKDSINKVYEKLNNGVNNTLEHTLGTSNITSKEILEMQKLNNSILFVSNLAQSEKYQVPIAIGENITNVNVTLVHNQIENGKVDINLTSHVLGQVTMQFTLKDNKLNGIINLDNRIGQDLIKEALPGLKEKLEQSDIVVNQLHVTLNTKGLKGNYLIPSITKAHDTEEISSDNSVNTNKLYEVAKNLLVGIKTIELTRLN
jgi:hypothetical protein